MRRRYKRRRARDMRRHRPEPAVVRHPSLVGSGSDDESPRSLPVDDRVDAVGELDIDAMRFEIHAQVAEGVDLTNVEAMLELYRLSPAARDPQRDSAWIAIVVDLLEPARVSADRSTPDEILRRRR
jgi:hypothetical protein